MADWKTGFAEITALDHKAQAVWWLNGFWADGAEAEAEKIWAWTQKFIELDIGTTIRYRGKKAAEQDDVKMGCDLDEFKAHQFLEQIGEVLTVLEMRKRLAELDIDNNKRVALVEFLLFKYNKTPQELVASPQGDNQEEIDAAAAKVAEVEAALNEVQNQLAEQKIALAAAKEAQQQSEAAAKAAADARVTADASHAEATAAREKSDAAAAEAKAKEDVLLGFENELKAAVADLERQEKEYHDKIAELKAKGEDQSTGVVTRNRAKNELAQLQSEDPLPLRKAKITQEAAAKRAEKARLPATQAREEAEQVAQAAAEAEGVAANDAKLAAAAQAEAEAQAQKSAEAAAEAEERTKQVELAVAEVEARMAEAVAMLEEAKTKTGVAHGAIWMLEREIAEAQKYMPRKK